MSHELDRAYVLRDAGLPIYDVIMHEQLPRPSSTGIFTVLRIQVPEKGAACSVCFAASVAPLALPPAGHCCLRCRRARRINSLLRPLLPSRLAALPGAAAARPQVGQV